MRLLISVSASVLLAGSMLAAVASAQGFGDVVVKLFDSLNQTGNASNSSGTDNGTNHTTNGTTNGSNHTGNWSSDKPKVGGHWRWSKSRGNWDWEQDKMAALDDYWPFVLKWIKALEKHGALDHGSVDYSKLDDIARGLLSSNIDDSKVGCFKLNVASLADYNPVRVDSGETAAAASASTAAIVTGLLAALIAAGLVTGGVVAAKRAKHQREEEARIGATLEVWAAERKLLPEHRSFADMADQEASCVVYEQDVVAMLATALVEEEELRREYAAWGISVDDEEEFVDSASSSNTSFERL